MQLVHLMGVCFDLLPSSSACLFLVLVCKSLLGLGFTENSLQESRSYDMRTQNLCEENHEGVRRSGTLKQRSKEDHRREYRRSLMISNYSPISR